MRSVLSKEDRLRWKDMKRRWSDATLLNNSKDRMNFLLSRPKLRRPEKRFSRG
jgi:hypothetical protein